MRKIFDGINAVAAIKLDFLQTYEFFNAEYGREVFIHGCIEHPQYDRSLKDNDGNDCYWNGTRG